MQGTEEFVKSSAVCFELQQVSKEVIIIICIINNSVNRKIKTMTSKYYILLMWYYIVYGTYQKQLKGLMSK